jgi:hypothetical protein
VAIRGFNCFSKRQLQAADDADERGRTRTNADNSMNAFIVIALKLTADR